MADDDVDQKIRICMHFHSAIADIIRLVKMQTPESLDLERLERLITLCKAEGQTYIIDHCKDKLWESRDQIKSKDTDYFFKTDFSKYIKKGSFYEEFQITLMDLIREGFDVYSDEEKNLVWKHTRTMLRCVASYMLIIGDHAEQKE
jgi:hypothetical protein